MLKILYELYSSQKAASIYTNSNKTDKFNFGNIAAINDREIAIHLITPDGEDDGLTVMSVDKVFRIETDGQYSEKMKKLCSASENTVCPSNFPIDNSNITESVLLSASEKNLLVSIELLDSGYNDVIGYIENITDGECMVRQIDEYGYADGYSYVAIKDITIISCHTQDEKRIMKLQQLNEQRCQ